MRLEGSPGGKRNAKRLRKEMTPPEIGLWLALRRNEAGLRFRKQHAVDDYVLDFYCAPARLAVEVDGEAHNRGDRPTRDTVRDAWLVSQGLRVLRVSGDRHPVQSGRCGAANRGSRDRTAEFIRGLTAYLPLRRLRRHLPLAGED